MEEYYRARKSRTSAKNREKTPYAKIFLRQLIAAVICFFIIRYAVSGNFPFSADLRETLKSAVNNNLDISEKLNQGLKFFNQNNNENGADENGAEEYKNL